MSKPFFIQSLSCSSLLLLCSLAVAQSPDAKTNAQDAGSPQMQSASQTLDQTEAIDPKTSTISTDFALPVTLDSRSQAIDGKNKTSIFTDNVTIRQGSLELLADKVEVNAAQGVGKEIIIASGQPSSYKQRKDDGSMVEANANEIIYDVSTRTISLKGNALIMQDGVRVTGDSIVFDMSKEQILASTDEASDESVRTVISPGAFNDETEKSQEQQNNQGGEQP